MDKPLPDWILERLDTTQQDRVYYRYPKHICEACDREVRDRRLNIYTTENQQNGRHTRTQCSVCKLYKNPETGEFNLTGTEITKLYSKLMPRDK